MQVAVPATVDAVVDDNAPHVMLPAAVVVELLLPNCHLDLVYKHYLICYLI